MRRVRINPRQVERMNDARKRARRVRRPPIPAPRIILDRHRETMADEIVGSMLDETETGLIDPEFDETGAPF